jgi:hypothetical protein
MTLRSLFLCFFVVAGLVTTASPAEAQRFFFDRWYEVRGQTTLDVRTVRGKIDVSVGDPGRVDIKGTVTLQWGFDVPANPAELARQLTGNPPVEYAGSVVRLRPPDNADQNRALTLSYEVRVPPDTRVMSESDSGATAIRDVNGAVSVKTQSASISISRLGGSADVTTGSGAVTADGIKGATTITTASSGITARGLAGSLRARTTSGAVDAVLTGPGNVDVETSSSAITLTGVTGGLVTKTESGRTKVSGAPGAAWDVSAGSSAVEIRFDRRVGIMLDATSGSSSVQVQGATVDGAVSKGRVAGAIGGGGPTVRLYSRSGSIRVSF